MTRARETKAQTFRLPADVEAGLKAVAVHRGEAISVVGRELLREALERRGVLEPLAPVGRLMASTHRAA